MAIFRKGTNPVWAAFAGIYLVGSIGADIYWLVTESGPVAYLAYAQAQVLGGSWYPKLTFLLLLLAQLGVMLALKFAIERITGKRLTAPLKASDFQ